MIEREEFIFSARLFKQARIKMKIFSLMIQNKKVGLLMLKKLKVKKINALLVLNAPHCALLKSIKFIRRNASDPLKKRKVKKISRESC
jgi:hypothetical protein